MVMRRGRTSLGCLFVLLLIVSGAYFGYEFLDAYYRYYTLRDAMAKDMRKGIDLVEIDRLTAAGRNSRSAVVTPAISATVVHFGMTNSATILPTPSSSVWT